MKRLVWLLLFAFGTLLAQVQPVDLPVTKARATCCADDCGCGMPECGLPPVSAPVNFTVERLTGELRQPARRVTARLPRAVPSYYLSLVEPAGITPARHAPPRAAPAASVPLFQAHCSLLI